MSRCRTITFNDIARLNQLPEAERVALAAEGLAKLRALEFVSPDNGIAGIPYRGMLVYVDALAGLSRMEICATRNALRSLGAMLAANACEFVGFDDSPAAPSSPTIPPPAAPALAAPMFPLFAAMLEGVTNE